jgi:hypothetical protein
MPHPGLAVFSARTSSAFGFLREQSSLASPSKRTPRSSPPSSCSRRRGAGRLAVFSPGTDRYGRPRPLSASRSNRPLTVGLFDEACAFFLSHGGGDIDREEVDEQADGCAPPGRRRIGRAPALRNDLHSKRSERRQAIVGVQRADAVLAQVVARRLTGTATSHVNVTRLAASRRHPSLL